MDKKLLKSRNWLFLIVGVFLTFISLMSFSSQPDGGGSFFFGNNFVVNFIRSLGINFILPYVGFDIGSPVTDIIFLLLYIVQGLSLIYMGWKNKLPNKVFKTSAICYGIWLGFSVLLSIVINVLMLSETGEYWAQILIILLGPLVLLLLVVAFVSFWIGLVMEGIYYLSRAEK